MLLPFRTLAPALLFVAALGAAPPAFAQSIPLDPAGFTTAVAADLKQVLPDHRVDVAGPLTIKLTPQNGGQPIQLNLDRVHGFCQQNADECSAVLGDFVAKSASTIRDMNAAIDRSMLRVVVRAKVYMDAISQQLGADTAKQLAMEPLTEDLMVVCYLDLPDALRPAMVGDFQKLGISKEEAMQAARANQASAGSLDKELQDLPKDAIGTVSGDVYASSWLALHEAWKQPVVRLGGGLIVAIPAADKLLYARDTGADSVDALRTLAEQTAAKSEKPLSTSVYRWTPQGWTRL